MLGSSDTCPSPIFSLAVLLVILFYCTLGSEKQIASFSLSSVFYFKIILLSISHHMDILHRNLKF